MWRIRLLWMESQGELNGELDPGAERCENPCPVSGQFLISILEARIALGPWETHHVKPMAFAPGRARRIRALYRYVDQLLPERRGANVTQRGLRPGLATR